MELQRLPDAEFELMKIMWHTTCPVTSTILSGLLPDGIDWKPQTILTLLKRMENRGFVSSHKEGKERLYMPLVTEMEYMEFEARLLSRRYEKGSLVSLVGSLYQGNKLDDAEISELAQWLKEKANE